MRPHQGLTLLMLAMIMVIIAGCARSPGAMNGGTDRTLGAATDYLKATK